MHASKAVPLRSYRVSNFVYYCIKIPDWSAFKQNLEKSRGEVGELLEGMDCRIS